jgi:hypothetical protein
MLADLAQNVWLVSPTSGRASAIILAVLLGGLIFAEQVLD